MIRRIVLALLLVVPLSGFLYWALVCPCDRTPGLYLSGTEARERVTDWSFANKVPLCQIQVDTGLLTQALNLNCMATSSGELYLSCAECEGKRWSTAAVSNSEGFIKLSETLYPVTFTRVQDQSELDRAWAARDEKLRMLATAGNPPPPANAQRPPTWWSFRVASR
jgi:hypothetical protein